MPGKHVRFSGKTTLYSPPVSSIPPPPPLTRKDYSPASSDSILTPPVIPVSIPYQYPVHPSSKSTYRPPTIRLHYVLEYQSSIYFDVRQHPSTIRARRYDLPSSVLAEPATSPPSQYMRLASRYVPWSIHPKPTGYSHSLRTYYVTVADVLDAIYFTLRTNITPAEYASLGEGSKAQTKVKRSYEERYRRIQDSTAYKEEKRAGVKRVDFLMGYNKFLGLTAHHVEKGEWDFHTEK